MIGTIIRNRRIELNITQEDLAKLVGYKSKSTINKIEMNINDIPLSKVEDFARALETTPAILMGWEHDNPQDDVDTLFINKYGHDVYAHTVQYSRLDDRDQGKVDGYVSSLLDSDKYKKGKSQAVRTV